MFSVIFEVHPAAGQWDAYLGNAKMLRPELERVDGFVDNIRYRSLTRDSTPGAAILPGREGRADTPFVIGESPR